MDNILPITYLVPGIAWKIKASDYSTTIAGMPRRLLLIGQAKSSAKITINKVTQITSLSHAVDQLGTGSMLNEMYVTAKANATAGLAIDVIALADRQAATQAVGSINITVARAADVKAGTLCVYIAGKKVTTAVTDGRTATQIIAALATAINADTSLAVVATPASGKVTVTCNWKGTTGNLIDILTNYYADEVIPTGVAVTITAMAGGATDPNITDAITAMTNYRATEIVSPYTDSSSMASIEAELDKRWGAANMQDGQLCVALRGTTTEHLTWLNSRNSLSVHSKHSKADLISPWVHASMSAAQIESKTAIDPVYPYMNAGLIGFLPAQPAQDFTADEVNTILTAGGSPTVSVNGKAFLGRMVVNKTTTDKGVLDADYRNLNWIKTMSEWRWYIASKFQADVIDKGFKIAQFETGAITGQKIVNANFVQEFMLQHFDVWKLAGRFQNRQSYLANLTAEIDGKNGKVKLTEQPNLVTQLYQVEGTTSYRTE